MPGETFGIGDVVQFVTQYRWGADVIGVRWLGVITEVTGMGVPSEVELFWTDSQRMSDRQMVGVTIDPHAARYQERCFVPRERVLAIMPAIGPVFMEAYCRALEHLEATAS